MLYFPCVENLRSLSDAQAASHALRFRINCQYTVTVQPKFYISPGFRRIRHYVLQCARWFIAPRYMNKRSKIVKRWL
jgi:hypothetical protein